MKAKVKTTGEIIEVEPAGSLNCPVSVYQTGNGRKFPMYALEFEKDIDWEQRRYEIAKDMIAAFLSNSCSNVYLGYPYEQAKSAVTFADALIAELKKGGQNG